MTAIDDAVRSACQRARQAARVLSTCTTEAKNAALERLAAGLSTNQHAILEANEVDLEAARQDGATSALLDRLMLDERRIARMAASVLEIQSLPDPCGQVISSTTRPSGIRVRRIRVPLGVIAMVFEARPNVTVEASALTLKAGNAVLLRGGSEVVRTNQVLAVVIREALEASDLPRDAVQVLASTDREAVRSLIQQTDYVDLAIPRGGESLIRFVTENARVPVVQHFKGVCHLFVDAGSDVEMAKRIVVDAKLSRPGVCNALECLLIDASDAERLLPPLAAALIMGGCELRGCERTCALVPEAKAATSSDWGREFLEATVAVRVVDGLDAALAHVTEYGSGHTEAIVTGNPEHAERWRREVDAACVVVNASTRFHDGGELGLGAEIGIATSRLHWRGPMGLESLTTMKWLVDGAGEVRT